MKRLIKRFFNFRKRNEDWVSNILKKRQFKPIILTLSLIVLIFSYTMYNSYNVYLDKLNKEIKIKNRVDKYKKSIKLIDKKIYTVDASIKRYQDLSLDSKESINFLNKVCQLLKKREVIGSFYIIKKQSKKYANVLNIEVQISYGDRDLLFLVTKIVLDKVFYLKNIEKTKLGLKAEIFKPTVER